VGGNFAFLALERACGGKAVDALGFLNDGEAPREIDVQAVLRADKQQQQFADVISDL
jgi:hypothetical protein